ncbi:MAG: hypothetical protein Q8R98_24540 [Rubrivivax sp.]|nr:hypothetical protein [Rubrivivax sp.]MDP3225293.1 hypothetical protein [Rubrivivax sp.]MDP3615022.1 hypothetical protein [Rubrivivax sp.]
MLRNTHRRDWANDLPGLAGRLRWHRHFMQKREDELAIDWHKLVRSRLRLAELPLRAMRVSFAAYPLVPDADAVGHHRHQHAALLVGVAKGAQPQILRPKAIQI